uniref:SREBP regulating gene protein-like n=1 Tax=Styela clava TaxID=7725 RepID=UPI00193AB46F|nr:SREBP regulating gene protein-like [Styela clava]XP_039270484.1 SREBP regulating gene protein-like [Styela clava]
MFCPRRFIRQRWVLAAILGSSIIYFTYNMAYRPRDIFIKDRNRNLLQVSSDERKLDAESIIRVLKWHSSNKNWGNSSRYDDTGEKVYQKCRNSVQGRELIADDRGFVCRRDDVESRGCCDIDAIFTNRYACDTCVKSNCCMIFEHCVSCCLQPDKKQLLEKTIRSAVGSLQKMIFTSVKDQFELCLSKCRTSSSSVQHENTYRDSSRKHCFGTSPPELHLG